MDVTDPDGPGPSPGPQPISRTFLVSRSLSGPPEEVHGTSFTITGLGVLVIMDAQGFSRAWAYGQWMQIRRGKET